MLSRTDEWVWDSWYVVDGDDLHAFYLMAPKSLGNPDLRHVNARVGHSVSRDGNTWTHLADAFGPSDGEDFDNLAIWTGSIVKSGDIWHLFYTGINRETREPVQKIGHATSSDLMTWERASSSPILECAAPYATRETSVEGAEHFRDPWVFEHDGLWHMYITANETSGWGTPAHATSADLFNWTLVAPVMTDSHFTQLEVTETICVDGHWFLLFCAGATDIHRAGVRAELGTFAIPGDGPLGPFDLDATVLLGEHIYAARAVFFRDQWWLLGFGETGQPGGFTGTIGDARRIHLTRDGLLTL